MNGNWMKERESFEAAASVASFRSNPIDTFRTELKRCIQEAVKKSQSIVTSQGSLPHFCMDLSFLREHFACIPWKDICEFHDNQLQSTASTSPLQETLKLICDPTIIPYACSVFVFQLHLDALLQSPRRRATGPNNVTTAAATRWSRSQLNILQSMKILWNCRPTIHHSANQDMMYLLSTNDIGDSNKWNRLLSVASYMSDECPNAHYAMIRLVLEISQRVDAMEIQQQKDDAVPTDDMRNHTCRYCRARTTVSNGNSSCTASNTRSKRTKIARLSDLHDEEISTPDYRPQYLPRYLPSQKSNIGWNNVLLAKQDEIPDNHSSTTIQCSCQRQTNNEARKLLTSDWAVVRSRSYRKFQSLFPMHSLRRSRLLSQEAPKFSWNHLLDMIRLHYQSPSLRLCLLLVTAPSQLYLRRITLLVWSKYSTNKDPLWLRIYSEMLMDWSFFDQREQCWRAMEPLLRLLMDQTPDVDDAEVDGTEAKRDVSLPQHHVFVCIATVLSRRCFIFQTHEDDISKEFQAFVASCKVYYGEINYWFRQDEIRDLRNDNCRLQTLQQVGILGLIDLTSETMALEPEIASSNSPSSKVSPISTDKSWELALVHWPFSPPFDLRSACQRVLSTNDSKLDSIPQHLSLIDHDAKFRPDIGKGGKKRKRSHSESDIPISNYIDNTDLLCQIFLFAGSKGFGNFRAVCQSWKNIIDDSNNSNLWYQAYQSRFGILPQDVRANPPKHTKENWKYLFQQKWIAEASLQHRRHQATGWKHRTCSFIGCYHVLKCERLMKIHLDTHAKKANAKEKVPKKTSSKTKKQQQQVTSS